MNMVCRPLDEREMRDLMHRLGWSLQFSSGDRSSFTWGKTVDGIHFNCTIAKDPHNADRWTHKFSHIPGVQLFVQVVTRDAAFPHMKFERWERRFLDYVRACELVAHTHS